MKVRASVKKRSPECKIVRRKGILYVINKRILDLNKDKDNYGKNSRVDIPKNKRGVIALTYIFGLGSSRAIEVLEKASS
jgi:small subunit ribosomal protein S13